LNKISPKSRESPKEAAVLSLTFVSLFVYLSKYLGIMRTLNVSISEIEYNKFGIKNDKLTFTDFVDIVSKELTRQNLNKCLELAEKYGLSKMTMEEITNEVKAVRQNAKNRN
jgi:hypothetical protein